MTFLDTSLREAESTISSAPGRHFLPHPTLPADDHDQNVAPQATERPRRWGSARLPRSGALLVAVDAAAMAAPLLILHVDTVWLGVTTLLTIALFVDGSMYRRRLQWSVLDDLPTLLWRRVVAVTIVTSPLLSTGGPSPRDLLWAAVWSTLALLVGRTVAYTVIGSVRRLGIIEHRTVLLGDSEVSRELARLLQDNRKLGLRPIGYFSESISLSPSSTDSHLPRLGGLGDVGTVIAARGVSVVLVTFGAIVDRRVVDVLRSPQLGRCEILIVPRLYEIMNLKGANDHIGAIPVVRLRTPRHIGAALATKRVFDVAVAAVSMVILWPLLLVCALAVRSTGAPVIFRQRRVGKDGRLFNLYKFRSMADASEAETSTTWHAAGDARTTTVGRVLRRTSLDELPQLWNILRGDMAVVGPRPERPHFAARFAREIPHYAYRHRVPVGLTGMAQVNALRGGDSSIALRARYDNYYIENWSLWGDVKVMVRTVAEVICARGS